MIFLDYEEAPVIFEVRGLPRNQAAREGDWGKNMSETRSRKNGHWVEAADGHLKVG